MRREFSVADQVAIIRRATDEDGRIHCERCGLWLKSRRHYDIDHIISEGIRPAADKKRKLTPADGQLLCKAVCHKQKTRGDQGAIGVAKRREAFDLGVERPGKRRIPSRSERKHERGEPKRAAGVPRLMREGFVPAGR